MNENASATNPPTFAEIRANSDPLPAEVERQYALWLQAMAELGAKQEETARQMKETDRRFKEQTAETDRLLREQTAETDRLFKETALQMEETARRFKEADRRLAKAEGLFTSQWGKLIESLVEGNLVRLLRERGVDVTRTAQRVAGTWKGKQFELDIVATNDTRTVVVEVKTTLRPEDVRRFAKRMDWYAEMLEHRRERTVYGAVAYLKGHESAVLHAQRQGLFVIRATGSSASIVNAPDFTPRAFP